MDLWLPLAVFLVSTACSTARPHIVLLVADDLGWNDVSLHGSPQIPTPNIDTLAAEGVVLDNYYVSPICTPSRGALLTGMHPIHLGLQHYVIACAEPWGLPLGVTTLPEHLKRLGYATHAIGKWHLGYFKKVYTPTYRGFDSHFGYWTGRKDYYDHTVLEASNWGTDFRNGMDVVRDGLGLYTTELFTKKAADIIRTHNSSQPLFLYLAHLAVHTANSYQNLQAPRSYVDRFSYIKDPKRRVFAGMVSALDDSVGKVFQALRDAGLLQDTVFVFTTDNGGAAGGVDNSIGSNWPLRGSKYTMWEGGVRGMAFVWSPLIPKEQKVSRQLMHISDWLPTLYHSAGGDVRDLGDIYGVDMWDCLTRDLPSPRQELLHNIDPIWHVAALRKGDYKLVLGTVFNGQYDGWFGPSGHQNGTLSLDTLNKWRAKSRVSRVLSSDTNDMFARLPNRWQHSAEVVCGPKPENYSTNCKPTESPCLYNVRIDPCEYNNIAEQYPQVTADMMDRLAQLNATSVPPRNVPVDPRASPVYWDYAWTNWKDEQ